MSKNIKLIGLEGYVTHEEFDFILKSYEDFKKNDSNPPLETKNIFTVIQYQNKKLTIQEGYYSELQKPKYGIFNRQINKDVYEARYGERTKEYNFNKFLKDKNP